MTANDLFGHIKAVGKEREGALLEEHEKKIAQIKKKRFKIFEELKALLEKEFEAERVSMIECRIREENDETKAEVSARKNEFFEQMKRKTKKMVFEMDNQRIVDIFIARLKLIESRLSDGTKLISSERYLPLAREISKRAGIECLIEVGDIPDGELILESKEVAIELSIEEMIEDLAEKNSAKLYEIIFG